MGRLGHSKEYQMRIDFTVKGRPPKKHGEKSMWAREDEAPFVFLLREKALEARSKVGLNDCFRSLVALKLTVFVLYYLLTLTVFQLLIDFSPGMLLIKQRLFQCSEKYSTITL